MERLAEQVLVLHRNQHFIVVDKPAGWLSVPSRFPDQDSRQVLGLFLEKELKTQVFPTHRLDCEVSGAVLYALNAKAHKVASQWFEQHQIQKTYQALTSGQIQLAPKEKVLWKSKILRGKKRAYESPVGKNSETQAQCLGLLKNYLDWRLWPITGRSHQLRFDLSRNGFPIVGDSLYGSSEVYSPMQIALRSISIQFPEGAAEFALPRKIECSLL